MFLWMPWDSKPARAIKTTDAAASVSELTARTLVGNRSQCGFAQQYADIPPPSSGGFLRARVPRDAGLVSLHQPGLLSCGGIDPVYTVYQQVWNYFTWQLRGKTVKRALRAQGPAMVGLLPSRVSLMVAAMPANLFLNRWKRLVAACATRELIVPRRRQNHARAFGLYR